MLNRQLELLVPALPVCNLMGPADQTITLITNDLAQVEPGALFIAYQGMAFDGHQNIELAVERGAVAIVAERDLEFALPPSVTLLRVPNSREAWAYLMSAWYDHPSRKLTLIGITGTDGKTSTTNLIYAIVKAAGLRTGMISTVNAVIGDQQLDTGFHVTTPDAPDVQRYLAQMVEAGAKICLLETTSHGLAYHRVTGCDYDLAVVTNITHEHLNHHNNSLEEYRLAKARLFEMAGQAAILNTDDWSYNFLSERIAGRIPIISYGLAPEAAVRAEAIDLRPDATAFDVTLNGQRYSVESPLVGAFNVSNILAALATTVIGLKIDPAVAIEGLRQFKGVPGRMERIDMGQEFTAIVDFAHTPNALKVALEAGRTMSDGQVISVFGSAGLRDKEKRRMMAETSAELADLTVLTAEDPRTESLEEILEDMAAGARSRGGIEGKTFWRVPDRGEAIRFALRLANPGDIVLSCGKGHEQSMCFGEREHLWDDRTAMRAALSEYLEIDGPEMPYLPTQNMEEKEWLNLK